MIKKDKKQEVIKAYQLSDADTGSCAVQIAILTAEINRLNQHLQANIHDFHTRRGLLKKVGRRRNLINYLKEKDINSYRNVISKLNLRK